MNNQKKIKTEIKEIEEQIEGLKNKIPAHSINIEMMKNLEELENKLETLKDKLK